MHTTDFIARWDYQSHVLKYILIVLKMNVKHIGTKKNGKRHNKPHKEII